MKDINQFGIWSMAYALPMHERIALAQQAEKMGYGAIWVPDLLLEDPFVNLAGMAAETSSIWLATGIASIYSREPAAMAGARASLSNLCDDRLILGLGVSHRELVSEKLGMDFKKPLAVMRHYLDTMEQSESPVSRGTDGLANSSGGVVVLAALREKMLALAAEKTDGAHPYLVTPEHTLKARQILGPDKLLAPEQKILLESNPSAARAVARQHLEIYLTLQNYKNNLIDLGFDMNDFDNGGSNRLIDALVIWGDENTILKRLEAHLANGANHVALQMLRPDGLPGTDLKAMKAFAPYS